MIQVSSQQNIEAKLDFLCFKSRDKSFIVSRHLNIEAEEPEFTLSWKDRLLGCVEGGSLNKDKDEIEFMDGDIIRSLVNGIPTISFFERTYSSVVKVWSRLPGLPGFLYKRRILEEIGGMIGKVAKLDFNTYS
ncbi:hypothetical protein PVK06_001807 [Gossypium arboreum]|uniref:DUF4283 domain-containing protein n=1 Tax=Gossypium arboreum TaxID=29729 RepID=A0ABR0R2Z2_GOSAR|nr:hypothetical protein PVK06_001807 [Gossypium arboreum]